MTNFWRPAVVTGMVLTAVVPSGAQERGSRRIPGYRRPSSVDARPTPPRLSQYLHQAPSGRFEVTPNLALYYLSLSRPTGSKETRTGYPMGVSAEYGFSSLISLAVRLVWDSASASKCAANGNCISTKSTGFFDPSVDLKLHSRLALGVISCGATVSYAVEKYQVLSSGDDNNATGGSAIAAFVGYELPLGPGTGGAKLNTDLYRGDRQADAAGTPYTVSGGSQFSLAAFYEMPMESATYGGALSILLSKGRTGYRADTGQTADYNDAYKQYNLKGYALLSLGPTMQLLPFLAYAYDKFANDSSFYELRGGADLRFSF